MDNVNDLKRTNIPQAPTQTISLNALRNQQAPTSAVNIDTTNGVTGVDETENQRPVVRINNRVRPTRRTVTNADQVQTVNPNDYIESEATAPKDERVYLQENAMNMLDKTIKRKQQEYQDFVDKAIAADEINRERVDNGLEEVNGEVDYIPEEAVKAEEEVVEEKKKRKAEIDEEEDFFDDEEDDESGMEQPSFDTPHVTINSNPFAAEEEVTEEEEFAEDAEEEFEFVDEDDSVPFEEDRSYIPNEEEKPQYNEGFTIDEPVEEKVTVEEDIPVNAGPEEEVVEEKKEEPKKATPIDDGTNDVIKAVSKGSVVVSSNVIDNPEDAVSKASSNDFNLDEEDFDDVTTPATDDGEPQLSDEEFRQIALASEKHLRNEILQKVIQTSDRLDTSSFVVSNKVISIKDAIKTQPVKERTASFPMMYSGRPFKASALKGSDISLLAEYDDSESENPVGLTIEQARIMYEHDANEYKPKTLEAWAKTIPFQDVESIFAAIYIASLKGANYIPMGCSKRSCMYSYLSDNIDINTMIKFSNDDVKKRFEEIKKTPITPENTGKYDSVVSVINNKFAIGLKTPSIYTVLYEYASLNAAFIRKYTSIISIMQYIDYIYVIDPETRQFIPVGWKAYVGDHGKTFRSKIATYAKIIKEFDDAEFSVLIALINSMITKNATEKELTYEIPAAKCPKCGSDIVARPISPRGLVFMRQRLVMSATTPIER